MEKNFDKIYVIDTNIILDSGINVIKLSNNSENLVVVPSIVLKELRKYKVGFEDINFNARVFNRLLSDSKVVETKESSVIIEIQSEDFKDEKVLVEIWKHTSDKEIENDDLIVDTAKIVSEHYSDYKVVMLSNDIDVRTASLLEKLETQSLILDSNDTSIEFNFHMREETEHTFRSGTSISTISEKLGKEIPLEISSFEFINTTTGKPSYFYRKNNNLEALDDKVLNKQRVSPINLPQKFMSAMILDETINIICAEARAGSGKNLVSLSSAMRLMDTRKDLYNKIIYIRKSVPSVDKESQIGFVKGSESEKIKGFLSPLIDTLEFMVEKDKGNKKEKPTKEVLEQGIEELINKYSIEVVWEGNLRGATIRNAIVIIDEASNFSRKSLQLILTRLGENSKAIIIGSNRQNDSYYLNKYTNGLTHTLKLCREEIQENVTLSGVILQKAIRSPIAEWADSAYE